MILFCVNIISSIYNEMNMICDFYASENRLLKEN